MLIRWPEGFLQVAWGRVCVGVQEQLLVSGGVEDSGGTDLVLRPQYRE